MKQIYFHCPFQALLMGLYVWVVLLTVPRHCFGQQQQHSPNVFNLTSNTTHLEVNRGVEYYEDTSTNLTVGDVLLSEATIPWKTFAQPQAISFGFNRSAYWLRFTLRNITVPTYNNWLFETAFPPLDSLDVYILPPNGQPLCFPTGDHRPFWTREIQFRTFVIPLQLPDSLPRIIYVRVRTTSSMTLPFTIYTREALIETGFTSLLLFGFVLGVVFVLGAYNVVPYLVTREKIYLWYLVYMSGAILFIGTFNGFVAQYILPQSGFFLQYCTLFGVGLSEVGMILFVQEFLHTKEASPRLNMFLSIIAVYISLMTLAGLVVDYFTVNFILVSSFLPLIILVSSIIIYIQLVHKYEYQYFFFINLAVISGFIGGLVIVMTNLGLFPNTALTRNSSQISIVTDALLFSLALLQRYKTLHEETLQAQEDNLRLQRDQNIKLQRAVEERTTTLQQRNDELAILDDEKNELMSIVAHDLKNPISVIMGYTALLEESGLSNDDRSLFLQKIHSTSDRMLQLVKNILDANRRESVAIELQLVSIPVSYLTVAIIESYESIALKKNITIHFQAESEEFYVLADEQALQQVLDNLISNAIKYSPFGKNVFVRIKSSVETVRMEVVDEGPGISQEDQKKLFGKFARLSAQPTGGEHSTGLGLSIVKKLVEAMNGRVWCESELGDGLPSGATFIVELPAAVGAEIALPL